MRLIGHCALEIHSVLTRLPPPQQSPAAVARDFIRSRLPEPCLKLGAAVHRSFVLGLTERVVTGDAAHDAPIAASAAAGGAELLTCDRPAAAEFESYGVRFRFVAR